MSFPEQDRAVQILEKEFGPRWKQIVQELGTKELRQRVGILKYALTGKPFHHALIIPGDLRAISKHIHEPVQFPVALQHFCHV